MGHLKVMNLSIVSLNCSNCVFHAILSFRIDLLNATAQLRVDENFVLIVQIVFVNLSNHVSSSNEGALLEIMEGIELVKAVLIEARQINTTGYEHTFGDFSDCFEWSLNSIKDSLEDAYTPFIINILKDICETD